jgi:hypothetical protein
LVALIVFLVLGVLGGYFLFRFSSNFIATATIFNPGGAPILNDSTADPNVSLEPGSPQPQRLLRSTPSPCRMRGMANPVLMSGNGH